MTTICSIDAVPKLLSTLRTTTTTEEEGKIDADLVKMWKTAVSPDNATRNKFITVHGNTNEENLAEEFAEGKVEPNIENSGVFYTVPKGIILVDLAYDNTVIYSNSLQDMENVVHKSHPNWITTPIFPDGGNIIDNIELKNSPSFKDEKKINAKHQILEEGLDETKKEVFLTKLRDIAEIEIQETADETNNNSSSITTTVKANTIKKSAKYYFEEGKEKWGNNKLSDFRQAMVNIADNIEETEIIEPLSISVKIVEEIDKQVVKEEFGLNDDLYSFDKDHPNFDPQGPNMPMLATHIYFPGDKIHNKMMEWDKGTDFNVFNMIDTKTLNKNNIDKKSIHNMLFEEAKEETSTTSNNKEKEIETIESYYIENSIKEYPSQIIYNAKEKNDYQLLKVYDKVNKTNFKSGKCDWFPLKALIDKINTKRKEDDASKPIIIYLNSCSPTIRGRDEFETNQNIARERRLNKRNIKKEHTVEATLTGVNEAEINAALEKALKKGDDDEAKKISKYLIQINDLKNEKYEIGRTNFLQLREELINGSNKFTEYKPLTVDDLPRLHKTIVMMGKTERAEWYRNIMGAFFHQLKTPIKDKSEETKQQKSFNVIYKQAKRDAFNRAIYVLRKNWKNYEKARSEENENWPVIKWPDSDKTKFQEEKDYIEPTYVNITTPEYSEGGRKKKTRKKRKKRRRKKTRRKRKKRRRKKTRKRRRRTRRKR